MGLRTFDGAVVLITGGASGIGRGLAEALVARGAHVVLADRQEEVAGVAAAVGGAAGMAEGHVLDVRDAAAVERLVGEVFARHGRLDYLFNNAGLGIGGEVADYTLDDWRYIVDVNLMGVVHGIQAAYPRMIRQGFGHLVQTASVAGLVPTAFTVGYTATKHAVVGLSRALRIEARRHGVRASVVCPGVIRTAILSGGGRYGRITVPVSAEAQARSWERLRPMDPRRFAEKVLGAVARDREVIVYPRAWRIGIWIDRLLPRLYAWFSYRVYLKARKELLAGAEAGQAAATRR